MRPVGSCIEICPRPSQTGQNRGPHLGIMPLSNTVMELTAAAILVPTVLVALLLVRRTKAA